MESIIADYSFEKSCYYTGNTLNLDKHHIFNGALRKWSEKNGLWIYVEHNRHMYLHQHDPEELMRLKRIAQAAYEQTHTREEFMSHVHKNYLDDDMGASVPFLELGR
jgi:hypothetical protein